MELECGKSLEEIEEKNQRDKFKRKEEDTKDREKIEFDKQHNIALRRLGGLTKADIDQHKYDKVKYRCGKYCAGSLASEKSKNLSQMLNVGNSESLCTENVLRR